MVRGKKIPSSRTKSIVHSFRVGNVNLSGMLSTPEVQAALVGLVTKFLNGNQKNSAIAGVDDDSENWRNARVILTKKGVTGNDILLLARMSEDNEPQFKMLLSILRK